MGFMEPEMKVVVKNTFLEWAEEPQPRIVKAMTHSVAFCRPWESTSPAADCGAAAVASAARAAAVATSVPLDCRVDATPDDFGLELQASGITWATSPKKVGTQQRSLGVTDVTRLTQGRGVAGRSAAPVAALAPTAAAPEERQMTTVMLRNLPNDYTRSMLLQLLDQKGFAGKYRFIYLPMDYSKKVGLGYAFVDLAAAADAQLMRQRLEGFRKWEVPSSKVCSVGWSHPCQGLDANIERYRNSPIMHASVPDELKPALFEDGLPVEFPKPTKRLRKPDLTREGRPKNRQ